MNKEPFKAWNKTFDFSKMSSDIVGEQVIRSINNSDRIITITPNPIDRSVYFIYSDKDQEQFIFEATYNDFMMLLTQILNKDDIDTLCVGDIFYRNMQDVYMIVIDKIPTIPVLQFVGVYVRIALLNVWLSLIKAHQGYSLTVVDIFVINGLSDWNLDKDESAIVFAGLYNYGIALYVYSMLHPDDVKGFSNYLYTLHPIRLRAIAYGLSALGESDKIMVFAEEERIDAIYPYIPKLMKWSPNPKTMTWEDIKV